MYLSLTYWAKISSRYCCKALYWRRTGQFHFDKFQQFASLVYFLSTVYNILFAVETKAVSCLVSNFATLKSNSIWRFLVERQLFGSRLALTGTDVHHCHKISCAIKLFYILYSLHLWYVWRSALYQNSSLTYLEAHLTWLHFFIVGGD